MPMAQSKMAVEQVESPHKHEQDRAEAIWWQQQQQRNSSSHSNLKYAFFTLVIVLLVIDIIYRLQETSCACSVAKGSERSPYLIGNGTSLELEDARKAISYSIRNLTGIWTFSHESKRLTRKKDTETEFFGHPSGELDRVWEDFIHHNISALLEHELKTYKLIKDSDRFNDHKVHFEPEVYHVLHCLNTVRQKVNRVLYPDVIISQQQLEQERLQYHEITDNWQVLHIEHCMDRIRQYIMCHADMTPSPFHGLEGVPFYLSDVGDRVCRDWEPLRKWTMDRWEVGQQEIREEEEEEEKARAAAKTAHKTP